MHKKGKKLTLNSVVLGNIRRRGRQNITLALGVVLAVFFLSASLFGASCLVASLEAQRVRDFGRANVFLWDATDELKEQIASSGVFSSLAEAELIYASDALGGDSADWYTVGRYTIETDAIQQYQLLEGRFPENEGEIAAEASILLRHRLSVQPGDEITLPLRCFDGVLPMAEPFEKTFTLVGILDRKGDPYSGQWHPGFQSEDMLFHIAPQMLVSAQEPLHPGSREMRMLIGVYDGLGFSQREQFDEIVTRYEEQTGRLFYYVPSSGSTIGLDILFRDGGEGRAMILSFIAVFLALTVAAMAAIAGALTANIDRRKGQIGMLRAIGATATQIRRILRRETLTILLITLPAGMLLSVAALKFLEWRVGGWFVWGVPAWMIAVDALACALCIVVASGSSVRHSVRITPMQAVRDIDLTRRFLHRNPKSKRRFVPQRLIAQRASSLRRGRSVGMIVLLAAGAILFSVSVMATADLRTEYASDRGDLTIRDFDDFFSADRYGFGAFLNEHVYTGRFTETDLQDVLALPYVSRVEAVVVQNANVFLDEIPDYITLGHFSEAAGYAFHEMNGYDRMSAVTQGLDVTVPENAEFSHFSEAYADYTALRERFHIEEEILATAIVGLDRAQLEALHSHAYSGVINVDKILSGEEVLVVAPAQIGLAWQWEDGASSARLFYDETRDIGAGEMIGAVEDPDDYNFTPLYENDVFRAGDTIEFEIWNSGSACDYTADQQRIWPDDLERSRFSARIGALLDEDTGLGYGVGSVVLVTGRDLLGHLGLSAVDIWLEDGVDPELQQQISHEIELIAGRSGARFYDRIARTAENRRMAQLVMTVCAVVCALFFGFTWAMLSNAVSGRIRSDIRQIGTMRAVGASMRVVFRSYVWQFYRVFLIGGLSAWAVSAALNFFLFARYRTWSYYLSVQFPLAFVTPLYCLPMLLLCMLGVYWKLRPVFRESVVANIRML